MTSKRQVDLHPEAVAEARAAFQWYRERSPSAAEAYLAELDRAIQSVCENPDRWVSHVHGTRRFLFRRFPFYLVYRERMDRVEILAVVHGRRRPGYWKKRAVSPATVITREGKNESPL